MNQLVLYLQHVIGNMFLCHNFGTPFADIENQNNDKEKK